MAGTGLGTGVEMHETRNELAISMTYGDIFIVFSEG
jgi:hypothetical protein